MIVLRVLSYNGAPADGPAAQFDELGGTIGRADNNQLVLPDPERTISRVHARLVFRAGGYAVVDNGSNPISVNGQLVGAGREQPLAPGDQVQIGGYVIQASAVAAPASDPFDELFGDAAMGLAAPPPVSAPAPARTAMAMTAATAVWPPPTAAADPWRAPAGPPPLVPPMPIQAPLQAPLQAPAQARAPVLSAGHIPDDWDPFAPDPAATAAPAPAAARDAFADLPRPAIDALDDLFGLGSPAASEPLSSPPSAQHADPEAWQLLDRTASIKPVSQADHVSELNTPMSLPVAPKPASPAPAPAPLPAGAIFSWNDPPRDGRVVTLPGVRRAEPAPPAMATPAAIPSATTAYHPPPSSPVSSAAPPTAPAAASAGDDALLQALLEGLGVPGLRLNALTPDTQRLIGQLLRESVRGAVELLVARAALKREMRAEMTMIVARENNPLKFSPTVDVALQHLLGAPTAGFMPAAPAVRDAFDDLRAHQLGVMAGMRAALDGVLQRFDPQRLEAKLTKRSAISSLIPATRKARLWELFQELFTQLQTEAQDDFDELFGKAFLRAYEDQLDRLQREPGPH
jgi:type VI secretion system FHA domain protein